MAPDILPPLEDTALFRGLSPEAVAETMAAASPRALDIGQTLFLQGEPVDALYVVETGRIKLSQVTPNGEEITVRTVGRGAIVAGVAILDRRSLPVTATALVPSRVLVWPRARILPLVVRHPGLRINVLETIADRMQASLTRIRELSTDSVGRRVARALLGLAQESGRAVEGGILIDQPLGRQELADLAGTSMFTASRLLAGWARDGVLDVGRQRVVVRSLEKLEALAGGRDQQ